MGLRLSIYSFLTKFLMFSSNESPINLFVQLDSFSAFAGDLNKLSRAANNNSNTEL